MPDFQSFLSNFSNRKKLSGGQYLVQCPGHSDKHNSLSIKPEGETVLLNCHAGCDTVSEVLPAIGLTKQDLYFDNGNGFKPRKTIAKTYDYRNEENELVYQNVRYEPKDFRQRRPDGRGGWIWNLTDVPRFPYRLPELLESACENPNGLVLFTEGEEDCDKMRRLGFTATSFKKWRREFSHYVTDAPTIILTDHDKSGLKQAADAADKLDGFAQTVTVIDLYEDEPLPENHGKDVSDWFAEGNTKDDLIKLFDQAENWIPDKAKEEAEDGKKSNLFKYKTANDWLTLAKETQAPKMLFGELWYEGELCILFADANDGKSALAVQIGHDLSRGKSTDFKLLCETEAQKVLYFDFELSFKQFEVRYSERSGDFCTNHFEFNENFIRVEIDPDAAEVERNFEDYLYYSLQEVVAETDAAVVIIDNITWLKTETEQAKNALPLMKKLKRIKNKFNLSLLCLAHTPKRDKSRPIDQNDLSGSKMIMNFCDSSFAIGRSSKDEHFRYIKQIKERNCAKKYGSENVYLCQISKPSNFLQFDFLKTDREVNHLQSISKNSREQKIEQAKNLYEQKGKSMQDIAKILDVSKATVHTYLHSEERSDGVQF